MDLFGNQRNPSGSRPIAKSSRGGGPPRGRAGGGVSFSPDKNVRTIDASNILRFGASPYALSQLRQAVNQSGQMRSFFQMAKRGVLNSQSIHPLFAQLRPDSLRQRVIQLWNEFERAPTTIGRPAMLEVQEGLIESVLTDGMFFFMKRNHPSFPHGFALLPVGREYLMEQYTSLTGANSDRNPVVAGMEFHQDTGRLQAYWFARNMVEVWRRQDPLYTQFLNNASIANSMVRVPVEQVIAVMTTERADEIVSAIPQSVLPLVTSQGLDKIDGSTIKVMNAAAKIAAVITKDKDAPIDDDAAEDEAADMDALLAQGELPDGAALELPAGYDLKAFQSEWPSMAGDIGRKAIIRNLASVLGISYAELANDAEASNFANTRTFSILTRERWRRVARMVTEQFVRPVMEDWLAAVQLRGLIPSLRPSQEQSILNSHFSIRAWQSVDPFKDANAAQIRLSQLATSPQRILAESGETIDAILDDFQEVGRKIRERDVASEGDVTRGLRYLAAFSGTPAIANLEVEDPATGEETELDVPAQNANSGG